MLKNAKVESRNQKIALKLTILPTNLGFVDHRNQNYFLNTFGKEKNICK